MNPRPALYDNEFEQIFKEHDGNIIHKWQHYFEIYERHFRPIYSEKFYQPVVILEIGIHKGGSLEMWRKYFGPYCQIIAIDINPLCKRFETENTKIFIGDQEDREFWRRLKSHIPKVDILIDDGGHMMNQLKVTFEEMYDWVAEGGVYLVEDLHTCYWPAYEGGYRRESSFIEYCKGLIDQLNAWHCNKLQIDQFTRNTHSIHFYDSVVVFEKRWMNRPYHLHSGGVMCEEIVAEPPRIKGWWRRLKNRIYSLTH